MRIQIRGDLQRKKGEIMREEGEKEARNARETFIQGSLDGQMASGRENWPQICSKSEKWSWRHPLLFHSHLWAHIMDVSHVKALLYTTMLPQGPFLALHLITAFSQHNFSRTSLKDMNTKQGINMLFPY